MTTTTPVIDKVNVIEQTISLSAYMELAGVEVRVSGMYNVDTNCYYPGTVYINGESNDLENYCKAMGWDYYDTHDAIQQAVEER